MSVFQYQDYRNPYGPSIAEALAHQADPQAAAALRAGDIQARADERQAALRGQLFTSLGAIPGEIQAQQDAAQKRAAQQQQLQIGAQTLQENQLTLADRQAQRDADARLSKIFADAPRNADDTYDTRAFIKNVPPELMKYAEPWVQKANTITTSWRAEDQLRQGRMQNSAAAVYQAGGPLAETLAVIHSAQRDRVLPDALAAQYEQQVTDDPTQTKIVLQKIAGYQKGESVSKDTIIRNPVTNEPIFSNVQPDKPDLKLAEGIQGQHGEPLFFDTHGATPKLVTAAGVNVMDPVIVKKPDPANADKDRYLQLGTQVALGQPIAPADQAWMKTYREEKLLATDTSASAAAARQAAATTAATAQQQRAQDFTQLQAARADIKENVDKPYATAKSGAETLRDVVTAAQGGNLTAAALQNLETTIAAVKSQGLNRINTAEIGATGNAGSMWDRLSGYAGQKLAGKPVPANIQQDMLDFADILDKAAYKKYTEAHDATNTLYSTKIPRSYAPPAAAAPPAAVPAPVAAALQSVGVGRHTLSDGSVWEKRPDGSIVKGQ